MFSVSDCISVLNDRHSWLCGHPFRCCNIMYDRSDGSLWLDKFDNENSWIDYHSPDIFNLSSILTFRRSVDFESLADIAELLDKGYEMEDFFV